MLAFGNLLTQGAVGVWVGRGSAEGRLWRGTMQGAALHMPFLLFLWLSRLEGLLTISLAAVGAMVYGLGLVYYTQRNILDKVVPPEIRDLVLKERRRAEREKMRGPEP
jgi:amino acid permease